MIARGSGNQETQYSKSRVTRGSVESTVIESGTVLSTGTIDVSSTITGIVNSVYVNNGDTVVVGQKLFNVTSTATDQEKASAYANYLTAKKGVSTAEQNKINLQSQVEQAKKSVYDAQDAVDKMNERIANGENNPATNQPYTQNEQDSMNSTLEGAKLSLQAKQQDLDNADQSITVAQTSAQSSWLSYQATLGGDVTATVAGVVRNISIAKGDTVSSSSSSSSSSAGGTSSSASSGATSSSSQSSGSTTMVIDTDSQTWVQIAVSEVDIAKINTDQTATIEFDAIADKKFTGDVERIDSIGTNDSGVVSYNTYLVVSDSTDEIKPSMTATVTVEVAKKDDVLLVPNAAIKSYKDGKAVQIIDSNSSLVYQVVQIGIEGSSYTEITDGLKEGDEIVLSTSQSTSSSNSSNSNSSSFGGPGGGAMPF